MGFRSSSHYVISFPFLITIVRTWEKFLPFGMGGLAYHLWLDNWCPVLYVFADRKLINTWDFLDIAHA